ncbi:uncharacterized protein [Littorina saxatilis]|uniref:uncharacterized protein n=1 Tax=Littorina saxatilis TaxID=31220 RepID=UPI0038B5BB4E
MRTAAAKTEELSGRKIQSLSLTLTNMINEMTAGELVLSIAERLPSPVLGMACNLNRGSFPEEPTSSAATCPSRCVTLFVSAIGDVKRESRTQRVKCSHMSFQDNGLDMTSS